MYWDKKTETLKGKELERLQRKRFSWTLEQAKKLSFYRRKFKEAGVSFDEIRSLEDLSKLPFTRKQDLRDGYPFGFFAVPLAEVVRIHTTSGTTGKPTVVGYTKKDPEGYRLRADGKGRLRLEMVTVGGQFVFVSTIIS